eukprot:m.356997 g.356997  ORF g.356997 m.356997 type:complete len:336 (-) comp17680_c0_seq1:561-1568(-)
MLRQRPTHTNTQSLTKCFDLLFALNLLCRPVKMDVDQWIETVKQCKYLPENELKLLCDKVSEILMEEGTVQTVSSPVTVCGDIHGQFYDLEELFVTGGQIPSTSYIFMGDFVDRGHYSLETFTRLLTLKVKYPQNIVLLRGNHETRQITQAYGFYDECELKYGNANAWKYCTAVFDLLSVAALIDNRILCVHGGLSPGVPTIDQIRTIQRDREIPHEGPFCDLVWSDPDELTKGWGLSPRGAGYLFGARVTEAFNELNGTELICRAHQLAQEGLKYMFSEHLATVWSAPNYCYRCGNVAAILEFDEQLARTPKFFHAVPDHQRQVPPSRTTPYFL